MDSFANKSNLKAGRKYGNDISSVGREFTLSANIHFPHEYMYMNPFSPS
jgi:hemerythrin